MDIHLLPFLQYIPKGQVSTYGNMASFLGVPKNSRQMGRLLGENKEPDVYPCYKVVGANGSLVGYSTERGLEEKRERLEKDGILVENNKIQDMEKYIWKPRLHSYFIGGPLEGENRKKFAVLSKKIAHIIPDTDAIHLQPFESCHITLHYFGDISLLQAASIVSSLRSWEKTGRKKVVTARFAGLSFFGKKDRREVGFFACSAGKDEIISLRKELVGSLSVRETTQFIPHLTFFRVRNAAVFSRYEKQIEALVSDVVFDIPLSTIRLYCAVGEKRQVAVASFGKRI